MIDESWYVRPAKGVKDRTSAGGVVVRRNAETGRLLVALTRDGGLSAYFLPKGGIEAGETLIETARREIQEEAGFSDLRLLTYLGARQRLSYERTRWITTHYFLFLTEEINPEATDPNHEYTVDWYPLENEEFPSLFWPEQGELLREHRNRILKLAQGETMVSERIRYYVCDGLAASPTVLERLLEGVTEEELDRKPDPERFTLREAIAHVADWEGVWLGRMVAIRDQDNPQLPGYDEGQWAIDHDYAHANLAAELAKFRTTREKTVALLKALTPEQWELPGVHAECGPITLFDLASWVLGHDGYHLRQAVEFRNGGV